MWHPLKEGPIKPKSPTFFSSSSIIEIKKEQLKKLKEEAISAPLKRARLCLHHNHEDNVQEMVIVFSKESYVRPHRHINKVESFHIIEGKCEVVLFDGDGKVTKRIKMSTINEGETFLYKLSDESWHTVIPLSNYLILHETTNGPFSSNSTEYPPWGPEEDDIKAKEFIEYIKI